MASILDRLNRELEAMGRRAQQALDEGRLQIELMRCRRQRDNAARDLGLLVHQRERGREADPARIEALLGKLDRLLEDIARLERELAAEQGETVSVGDTPAPGAGAEEAEAEPVTAEGPPADDPPAAG